MDTFIDLIEAVTDDASISANSTYITPEKVKKAINRSNVWAGTLYEWPSLENAATTDTVLGDFYYDYPLTFKDDSIYMLEIDGLPYEKKNYEDFIAYKRNHPTNNENVKIFASHGRQYFVFPTPTTNGTENISVWGNDNGMIIPLVGNGDTTIFSYSSPQGNIAIAKYAVSILLPRKKDKKTGMVEQQEAEAILTNMYAKVIAKRQREQRIEHVKFTTNNYFGRNTSLQNNF